MGPSATCASHSAAPGVDPGLGQHTTTNSGTYNGFSKVRYICIDLSFFSFAVLNIFQINILIFQQIIIKDMKKESGSLNLKAGNLLSTHIAHTL